MDIIERIYWLMERDGINPTELSRVTGVSNKTISGWKNGHSSPKTDAIIKIAKYFNVATDYLLGMEEKGLSNNRKNEVLVEAEELMQFAYEYVWNYSENHKDALSNMTDDQKITHLAKHIYKWPQLPQIEQRFDSVMAKGQGLNNDDFLKLVNTVAPLVFITQVANALFVTGVKEDEVPTIEALGVSREMTFREILTYASDFIAGDRSSDTTPKSEEAAKLKIPPSLEGALVAFHRKQGDFTEDELEQIETFVDLLAARRSRKRGD